MKLSFKIILTGTLLSVGCLTGISRSHAALLAYDGFDYSAGNVNGDNGGTGWSSSWSSSVSPVYASVITGTPLNYTGGAINITGSGSALSIIGGGAGALNRAFVGTSTGDEIYFSFLFKSVVGGGNEFFHFYLSEDPDLANSGGIGDFYSTAGDSHLGVRVDDGTTSSTSASTISYTAGTTYLLVGRLSTDGITGSSADIIDQVEFWINPASLTPGTADATEDASTGLILADLESFSSRLVNFAGSDEILIDELRIGTDFTSVVAVPEPSVGLFFLGGIALLALRRRTTRRTA